MVNRMRPGADRALEDGADSTQFARPRPISALHNRTPLRRRCPWGARLRTETLGSASSPSSQRAFPEETSQAFSSLPSSCPYSCSWFDSRWPSRRATWLGNELEIELHRAGPMHGVIAKPHPIAGQVPAEGGGPRGTRGAPDQRGHQIGEIEVPVAISTGAGEPEKRRCGGMQRVLLRRGRRRAALGVVEDQLNAQSFDLWKMISQPGGAQTLVHQLLAPWRGAARTFSRSDSHISSWVRRP